MKLTVLFAEVDPELVEMFRTLFTHRAYRALSTLGGVKCLPIIWTQSPAVVVTSEDRLQGSAYGMLDSEKNHLRFNRAAKGSRKSFLFGGVL